MTREQLLDLGADAAFVDRLPVRYVVGQQPLWLLSEARAELAMPVPWEGAK